MFVCDFILEETSNYNNFLHMMQKTVFFLVLWGERSFRFPSEDSFGFFAFGFGALNRECWSKLNIGKNFTRSCRTWRGTSIRFHSLTNIFANVYYYTVSISDESNKALSLTREHIVKWHNNMVLLCLGQSCTCYFLWRKKVSPDSTEQFTVGSIFAEDNEESSSCILNFLMS